MIDGCVFCAKIAAGDVERRWPTVVCFEPLDPVTPGHMLVVPVVHVEDVGVDPFWSGQAMHAAAQLAAEVGDCNVITSRGTAATQTIRHLHIHVVPRRPGDGLKLPWTDEPASVKSWAGTGPGDNPHSGGARSQRFLNQFPTHYVTIRFGVEVARTVELGDLAVDLDDTGRVLGVASVGPHISASELATVLRHTRWGDT